MKINIVESKVLELSIKSHDEREYNDISADEDSDAKFSFDVQFFQNSFHVTFNIALLTQEGMLIQLKYQSEFLTDVEINEAFKNSDFPYVNAPAIAYPYLRAFISNLTLNSGYLPIMLQSVNFSAMRKRKNEINQE